MNWIKELLKKEEFTYENIYQVAIIILNYMNKKGERIIYSEECSEFERLRYFDGAVGYFERSLELLKIYLEGEINPKEMKIYLSNLCLICHYYRRLGCWTASINYGTEALQFFENVISNIDYYVPIYGESDANEEMNLLIQEQRLIVKTVYEHLAHSYNKRGADGDIELREYYREFY